MSQEFAGATQRDQHEEQFMHACWIFCKTTLSFLGGEGAWMM
jgi:hypothetical protein